MLRRPIIVLSENVVRNIHGESISPNDLFGIYLPVFILPSECVRDPIVLAYNSSHFCPLQTCNNEYALSATAKQKGELDNLLPLYQSSEQACNQNLLPVHFLGNDVSEEHTPKLLRKYLLIETVLLHTDSDVPDVSILCAHLGTNRLSVPEDFLLLYRKYIVDFLKTHKRTMQRKDETGRERKRDGQKQSLSHRYHSSIHRASKRDSSLTTDIHESNNSHVRLRYHDDASSKRRSSYDDAVTNGTNLLPWSSDNPTPPLDPVQISQNGDAQSHEKQIGDDNETVNAPPTTDGKINHINFAREAGSTLTRNKHYVFP
jgi:hypothetical protein